MPILAGTAFTVSAQPRESVSVSQQGDSVIIEDRGAIENCASRFLLTLSVVDSAIEFRSTDTVRDKMRCVCEYDFRGAIASLAAGRYAVRVVREYLVKYGYPSDTIVTIAVDSITVTTPSVTPMRFVGTQTPCKSGTGYESIDTPSPPPACDIFPNPLYGRGTVVISGVGHERVVVEIHDALGRRVMGLYDGYCESSHVSFPFPASTMPPRGVYHVVVRTPSHTRVQSCVLMY